VPYIHFNISSFNVQLSSEMFSLVVHDQHSLITINKTDKMCKMRNIY